MEPEPLHPDDPSRLGDYRLIGRLGEGGMGAVFLGVTPGGRKVAVKTMRRELAEDLEFRYRFAREEEAAYGVGGFYTAQVVDAEPDDPLPWIAFAYIPGPSLTEVVRTRGPLGAEEVFRVGAALAEALIAIHSQELIHRDLKPSNVIMADDGPRIIDFGVARPAAASSITATGIAIGSIPYMSPEHLSGKVIPQSDIFSLGGVLTYASTGHGPFDAATNSQIEIRILNHPPDLGPLSGDLRKIISACLEKKPADRPSLRDLLTQFSDPGAAAGPGYQPTVTIPGKRGLSPIAPPLTAHGTQVTNIAFSPDGRLLATADRDLTVALWDTATWTLVGPPVSVAARRAKYDSPVDIAFSPDSRLLVSIIYHAADGNFGGNLAHVWNAADMSPADMSPAQAPDELSRSGLQISPDGRHIVSMSYYDDRLPRVWDITGTFSEPRALEVTGQGDSSYRNPRVAFSPDGRFVADHGSRDVRLWDLATGALIPVPPVANESWAIRELAISPRGGLLALSCQEPAVDYKSLEQPSIRLLDVAAGESAKARIVHEGALSYGLPLFSPDGRMQACLAGGRVGEVNVAWIWDPVTGRPVDIITHVWGRLAFSPDSRFLATGAGSFFAIRDTVARRTIRAPKETGNDGFQALAFSADSRLLASSEDAIVRIWRLPDA